MEVREEVRQLARPLADELGFELVHVEQTSQGRNRVIRVLLDKPGGITVGDCARFSRKLSDCLDMNQTVPGSYQLEVSSPGIERPITTLEAVEHFAGKRVTLTSALARDGRRHFEGELLKPVDGRAGVKTDDGEHWFDWSDVRSLRLVVDPWAGLRRRDDRRAPADAASAVERPGAHRPRGGA